MAIKQPNNLCYRNLFIYFLFAVLIFVSYSISATASDDLLIAIKESNVRQVKLITDEMSLTEINRGIKYGNTYLHTAVKTYTGIVNRLQRPLKLDLIKKEDAKNIAIEKRNKTKQNKPYAFEIIKWLLGKGADPGAKNKAGMTPLLSMNQHNQIYTDVIRLLIEYGADINDTDKKGDTLLLKTSKSSAKDFDYTPLFQLGSDINIRDRYNKIPLMYVIKSKPEKTVKQFLEHGADIQLTDKSGATALHYAAAGNKWRAVYYLLEAGADIEAVDRSGQTPISYAANAKKWNMVKRLLKLGANSNTTISGRGTVADIIFSNQFLDLSHLITKETFRKVKRVSTESNRLYKNYSPLAQPITDLNVELVEKYLTLGVNPDQKDNSYFIPLHEIAKLSWIDDEEYYSWFSQEGEEREKYAAEIKIHHEKINKIRNIFKLLIENGANVNIKNKDGKTALMIAASQGSQKTVDYLLENGADINAQDNKNTTALMYAANAQHWNLVYHLINKRADVTIGTVRDISQGGLSLTVISTGDTPKFAKPSAVDNWPLELVFNGYMEYLRDGETRRQRIEAKAKREELKEKIHEGTMEEPVFHIPKREESQKQVIREYWESIKAEFMHYLQEMKIRINNIFIKNSSDKYSRRVNNIDYGNEEFKNLLIYMMEAFPKDYEIDLDNSTFSFTYLKIFTVIEGVDPEIKEAASKLKVKYKQKGVWFYQMLSYIDKGELNLFPSHATEGMLKTYDEYKFSVEKTTE